MHKRNRYSIKDATAYEVHSVLYFLVRVVGLVSNLVSCIDWIRKEIWGKNAKESFTIIFSVV